MMARVRYMNLAVDLFLLFIFPFPQVRTESAPALCLTVNTDLQLHQRCIELQQ